ncbi:right-handed parallel beta-helix repeat-containing protein [Methanimicrococcus blatticola]|uniref:Outer membrane repeat protein n=1 Tax=Methanimicrococcus blatticola TaxID=91560 RepID=A0A484F2J0_9EURY|nr:right-handed parallel beta-helix repeat-containing protein [Methanimicrococcus blatticola]MBZ3935367.1 hypothetical protein [Methanimicrococcus blatticola]MCC2508535.1 right-handed parallel beta-helix repeat-containing protein [Methanimicrococcus blatticola]TDQ67841.1 hypothetical protein C7391_1395 [Methanimicrococcus blatticola]
MQSKIVKTLVLSVLILFLLTGVAAAQEWVVTAPGDVDKVNLSMVNLDKMTLREAIAKAGSGDTIVFSENISAVTVTYNTLNVSKDLTIGGNTKVTVARDSGPVTQEFSVFTVSGGDVVFKQLSIENGYLMNGTGGAVTIDRANVTFESCTIQRNKADLGGGVYAANSSNVKFVSTSVFKNNATTDGSAIYLKGGSVELQNSVIDGHSDKYNVIKVEQGKIIGSQSRIINNAVTSKGSPLNASAGTTVEFRNSTFSNNTATEGAGITSYGALLVENCVFNEGKTSGSGGGILLENGSSGNIRYSIFSNATVADDGGGIHIASNASATIDTCTFLNNLANYGGAFFNRGTVNANAITAVNNTAKFYGGAIAFWNDANSTLTKSAIAGNIAKSNNTAKDVGGGGLNVSNSQATLSNNVIVGNTDPRKVDFGELNSTVKSGGNNLVGTYHGNGRFPIDSTDVSGIQLADVFVIENDLPAVTKSTGHTAGYDKVPVYTIALNSSADNPAASILGGANQTPTPEPPEENETNQTPPEPDGVPPESGLKWLVYGAIIVILLIVVVIGIVAFLKYRQKNQYKFG